MTKEELKALGLSDELVDKIYDDYGKNYVTKAQFNVKNEETKKLKEEKEIHEKDLKALQAEMEGLKKLV